MSQELIYRWIARVIEHLQRVLKLDRGNEYQEGRLKGQEKRRVYQIILFFNLTWLGINQSESFDGLQGICALTNSPLAIDRHLISAYRAEFATGPL